MTIVFLTIVAFLPLVWPIKGPKEEFVLLLDKMASTKCYCWCASELVAYNADLPVIIVIFLLGFVLKAENIS